MEKLIGKVRVDSGIIIIADPAYAFPDDEADNFISEDFMDIRESTQLDKLEGVVLTGFGGDGEFPVYGNYDEENVLTSVVIKFNEDDITLSELDIPNVEKDELHNIPWNALHIGDSILIKRKGHQSIAKLHRAIKQIINKREDSIEFVSHYASADNGIRIFKIGKDIQLDGKYWLVTANSTADTTITVVCIFPDREGNETADTLFTVEDKDGNVVNINKALDNNK